MAIKPVPPPKSALRRRLCEEYLVDRIATNAARRAGYKESSIKNAGVFLAQPDCKAYVDYLMNLATKKTRVTVERILEEYAKLAFHDVRKLYDDEGNLIPVPQLGDDEAGAVAGIEVSTMTTGAVQGAKGKGEALSKTKTTKIRLTDKKAALDSLAKHIGMFKDQVDVNHTGNVTLVLSADDAEL